MVAPCSELTSASPPLRTRRGQPMTIRERIEQALRLQPVEGVPFTCYEGLLPAGGVDIEGLGLVRSCAPYTIHRPNAQASVETEDDGTQLTVVETPVGRLTQRARKEPGYGSLWKIEHFVKAPEDYGVLACWLDEGLLEPKPDNWMASQDDYGDRGVVLASLPRAPLQRLWIEFTGVERLCFDLHDCPERVQPVLEALARESREAAQAIAEGPAEFVWLPDNITGEIAGPRLFAEHLAPYYAEMADLLHPRGKRLVCHMDGMIGRLRDSVSETKLDVIEAFTPPPDGDLPLDEARRAWQGKAIWINFPSSVHLAGPERIRQITRRLVEQASPTTGFLISITENIPATVGARSLEAIAEALRDA
jgi:hypothetical protein